MPATSSTRSLLKRSAAGSLAAALVTGLIIALPNATAAAAPTSTEVVRQSDFIPALSDTRSAGHRDPLTPFVNG